MNLINYLTRTTKVKVYLDGKHIHDVAIPNKMIEDYSNSKISQLYLSVQIGEQSKKTSGLPTALFDIDHEFKACYVTDRWTKISNILGLSPNDIPFVDWLNILDQ